MYKVIKKEEERELGSYQNRNEKQRRKKRKKKKNVHLEDLAVGKMEESNSKMQSWAPCLSLLTQIYMKSSVSKTANFAIHSVKSLQI